MVVVMDTVVKATVIVVLPGSMILQFYSGTYDIIVSRMRNQFLLFRHDQKMSVFIVKATLSLTTSWGNF